MICYDCSSVFSLENEMNRTNLPENLENLQMNETEVTKNEALKFKEGYLTMNNKTLESELNSLEKQLFDLTERVEGKGKKTSK